nr:MAG: DNA pilot protein [Microvirus sp.]
MWPMIGSLISGGASLLGGMFSSNTSANNTQAQIAAQQGMQKESEEFNAGQAQLNRDFQSQMSSTAYQRAAKDMKDAGLNPMMMAGGSMNASTPSGATASTSTPSAPMPQNTHPFSKIGDAVDKVISSAIQQKTLDKMTEEIANLKTSRSLTEAEAETERRRPALVTAEGESAKERVHQQRRDVPRQEWDAIKYLDLSHIPDAARKTGNIASWGGEKAADVINPLVSSAGAVRRFMPNVYVREGSRSVSPDGKSFDEFWKSRTGFGR